MFCIGDQIGPYSLLQKIGRGAFGEVWLAEEKTFISSHRVALKLPNEQDVDLEAIRQEATVWEEVKGHPNILPIIKADIVDEQIYIASEYAPDGSLSKWLKLQGGKAPTVELAVRMTRGILSGLAHLHSKGIVHRDLKPENILLQADTPRIADFGIARLIQSTSNSTTATGTPAYMAPECFYGTRSERTDLWAVGVIFHLLLTGKQPFPQPDQVSVMNAIINGSPEIESAIPSYFQRIIATALARDPIARYAAASDMLGDMEGDRPESDIGERRLLGITVPTTSEANVEIETVVIQRQAWSATPLDRLTSPTARKIGVIGVGVLLLAFVGFQLIPIKKEIPQLQPEASGPRVQPIGPAGGGQEEALSKLPAMTDAEIMATTNLPAASPQHLPGGDEFNPWANGGIPSAGPPLQQYVPPGGQVYQIDPNGGSQIMPQEGGVILVPVPANTNTAVKPEATPKTAPANTVLPTGPETRPTPKPMATPPPKNDKPAANRPVKGKPADKPVKNGEDESTD